MEKEIYLAGGCFWGVEKYLALLQGVVKTQVGYANGATEAPTYEQVCREHTGHAETVKVVYDESQTNLAFLLRMFYEVIDPTSLNRQGGDSGEQYRTGVYYTDPADRPVILASIERLQEQYTAPIVVEAAPLQNYYTAEEYHQSYLDKNPEGYCHLGSEAFRRARQAAFIPDSPKA